MDKASQAWVEETINRQPLSFSLCSVKSSAPWRFRRFCCVPYFAIFLVCVDVLLAGVVLLILYFTGDFPDQTLSVALLSFNLICFVVMCRILCITTPVNSNHQNSMNLLLNF